MPWESWKFSEVMFDAEDPVTLVFGVLSLLPIMAFFVAWAFFLAEPRRATFAFMAVYGANFIINYVLKKKLKDPRPTLAWDTSSMGYGMPSAHAQVSFGLVCQLWPLLGSVYRRSQVLALAVAVCVGRWYNGYHTWEQVAAGAACGVFVVLWLQANRWMHRLIDAIYPPMEYLARL
jgi:membrane-associated phospholipid phosphatase